MNINTDQLTTLLGSEAAARRFVDMFLEKLPEQLAILEQSLIAHDWETASLTAHGLKSQFRYLGLNQEADLLQHIENEPNNEASSNWLSALKPEENAD
jgi:HPt (histidine-containing phosphotransfer) domain-containing protein